jgi:hypothetical protein
VFYLFVAYGCNGFQVFSGVFFKCLRSMFQVFICLRMYVATVVFGCFKSRSGVASLLLVFCYIVSVCPLGAGKVSIRRYGHVLPNRRRHPLPLLSLGRHGLRVERVKRSAACGPPGTSTADSLRQILCKALQNFKAWARQAHITRVAKVDTGLNGGAPLLARPTVHI